MKTSYLCHITAKNGKYSQQIIEGILDLKSFLRSNRVHFQNEELSYLTNRVVRYRNPLGVVFEVEVLADTNAKEVDGVRYLTIKNYCAKYGYCRQTVYSAMYSGRVRAIELGNTHLIQDIPIAFLKKKKTVGSM